jgi:hypothetical protein
MKVYNAINAVQRELAATGITKDRRNQQQGYSFRGIDDVFNALAPLLARHGLCILPRVVERDQTERQTAKGGTLFFVTVGVEFDLVAAEDGSKHTIKTYGEAMDSADKATNKAMSAAYKYAAFQAFAIPTEADNDADAHTHDVRSPSERLLADIKNAATEADLLEAYGRATAAAKASQDGKLMADAKAETKARKAALEAEAAAAMAGSDA